MWALLILASCGPVSAQVAPAGVESLPPNPTIFVTRVDPEKLRFEDAKGAELAFTWARLSGDFVRATVTAPEGSEFFLVLPDLEETRRPSRRRGPWRVSKTSTPFMDRSAPTISRGDEIAYEDCADGDGWSLASDRSAPVWELELTSGGKSSTAYDFEPFVGAHSCGRRTYSWNADDVSVRVRGRYFDGTVGEWSNAVVLSKPTPSIFSPVRNFLREGFVGVGVLAMLVLLGAMVIGALAAVGRKKLSE